MGIGHPTLRHVLISFCVYLQFPLITTTLVESIKMTLAHFAYVLHCTTIVKRGSLNFRDPTLLLPRVGLLLYEITSTIDNHG